MPRLTPQDDPDLTLTPIGAPAVARVPMGTGVDLASTAPEPYQDVVATFCFVDIAGYTALTDSHGERAAADLVDGFNGRVWSAVDGRGHVQELSGDSAFLVFPDPVVAMQAIAILYREIAGMQDFPMLRCGLHHGSALLRSKRYFGSTINTAARTVAQAGRGEVMCTAPVAQALASSAAANYPITHVGKVKLKNLADGVDLYRIALAESCDQFAIDPVCQMQVDTRTTAASSWLNGRQYWFCTVACCRRFEAAPSNFV